MTCMREESEDNADYFSRCLNCMPRPWKLAPIENARETRQLYSKEIELFFKPSVEVADRGQPFNWSTVSEAPREFGIYFRELYFQEEFVKCVLKLFDRYRCTDLDAIAKVLYVIYCLDHDSLHLPFHHFMEFTCRSVAVRERSSDIHSHCVVGDMVTLMKVQHGQFKECFPLDPLRSALFTNERKFLETFIKFGVAYLPPIDDPCEWEIAVTYVNQLSENGMTLFLRGQELSEKMREHYGQESWLRVLTVVRAIGALALHIQHLRVEGRHTGCVQRFRQIFQTIPEPYVTSGEVAEFLDQVEKLPSAARDICEEFEFFFPESVGPKRPRSLLHLSRCQVRQTLRSAGALPYGVKQLGLPSRLEKYVLLQEGLTQSGVWRAVARAESAVKRGLTAEIIEADDGERPLWVRVGE